MEQIILDCGNGTSHFNPKAGNDRILLVCRLPIDRSEDEWLVINDTYDKQTFIRQITNLVAGGKARLVGRNGRLIFERDTTTGFTKMELGLDVGPRPRTLIKRINVRPEQLMLPGE